MLNREVTFCLIEVQSQPVIHIDGRERTDARFRPRDAQKLSQELGGSNSITRRDEKMVQLNRHHALLRKTRSSDASERPRAA
jgi:hypothetical protein